MFFLQRKVIWHPSGGFRDRLCSIHSNNRIILTLCCHGRDKSCCHCVTAVYSGSTSQDFKLFFTTAQGWQFSLCYSWTFLISGEHSWKQFNLVASVHCVCISFFHFLWFWWNTDKDEEADIKKQSWRISRCFLSSLLIKFFHFGITQKEYFKWRV